MTTTIAEIKCKKDDTCVFIDHIYKTHDFKEKELIKLCFLCAHSIIEIK